MAYYVQFVKLCSKRLHFEEVTAKELEYQRLQRKRMLHKHQMLKADMTHLCAVLFSFSECLQCTVAPEGIPKAITDKVDKLAQLITVSYRLYNGSRFNSDADLPQRPTM